MNRPEVRKTLEKTFPKTGLCFIITAIVLAVPMAAFSQDSDTPAVTPTLITVQVDQSQFTTGDRITVSGMIHTDSYTVQDTTIQIKDPLNSIISVGQISVGPNCTFSKEIITGPAWRTTGMYLVVATYAKSMATATFEFFGPGEYVSSIHPAQDRGSESGPKPSSPCVASPTPPAQKQRSESGSKPSSSGAPKSSPSSSTPPVKEPKSGTKQESPASGVPNTTPTVQEQESAPQLETALTDIPPPPPPPTVQESPASGVPPPPPPPPPPPVPISGSGLDAVPSAVPLPPVASPIPTPVCAPEYEVVNGRCELVASGSGGCLIATAAYGTEMAGDVQMLREIRDDVLLTTGSGASFVSAFNGVYYTFSPAVADLERQSPEFQAVVRTVITPMIATLVIMSLADGGSETIMVGLGMAVIALNLGMYVGVPVVGAVAVHGVVRRRSFEHTNSNSQ